MTSTTLASLYLLVILLIHFTESHIDWCEYWIQTGQQSSHPECSTFLSWTKTRQQTPNIVNLKKVEKCGENEIWSCAQCETTCAQMSKLCTLNGCRRACICSSGYVRDLSENKCIRATECNSGFGIVQGVKEIVPIIIKDVWSAIFTTVKNNHGVLSGANTTEILEASPQKNDTLAI